MMSHQYLGDTSMACEDKRSYQMFFGNSHGEKYQKIQERYAGQTLEKFRFLPLVSGDFWPQS